MSPIDKPYLILVGIDYSTASELALERALELASSNLSVELHVVHVTTAQDPAPPNREAVPAPLYDDASVRAIACRQLETYVAVSVAAFKKKHVEVLGRELRLVVHLRTSAPSHEIAQLASDLSADLVVVGMHGHSAISHYFLGSVAESVTRLAPCPVLVFRPKGLATEYPRIEPPCPKCISTRASSEGALYWCEQHREHHGQRHTYNQRDRMSESVNSPLVLGSLAQDR